ncbi:MAG: class I SAM-dependent methyltransferase [Oligoflexia bacterium]|nr:class I SAM-dependent methyltransferase [Oligoflexia bacterium]
MQIEANTNININTKYYSGSDLYSEGAIEDELLKMVTSDTVDNDPQEILRNDNRFSVLYHFSPQRADLLRWFPFSKDQTLLEIGAGCGALTGFFLERLKRVVAIDLSYKRSLINYHRHKQHIKDLNFEIIVGNIDKIEICEKFDFVTLIGVLEYAKKFSPNSHSDSNGYEHFFNLIKKFLHDNGKLIIAIENKFGLKYWAGHREDHTGRYFDSIEGYRHQHGQDDGAEVETFGLVELKNLLLSNGFSNLQFYYPYPDYKFPIEVYSEELKPSVDTLLGSPPNYTGEMLEVFSIPHAYLNIIKNDQFDFFSNSFLCVASI